MKIWITGCNGMLGKELGEAASRAALPWTGSDRDVDITNPDAIDRFAAEHRPTWLVNCAAYTAVDKAESEPETARKLNADGPGNLARLAHRLGIPLVHFSTDYVFDGSGNRPWNEGDRPAPLSVYGRTKLEGEKRIAESMNRCFLFRISWLYGQHGPNFVRTILRLLREKESLRVVSDQTGSPTWTLALAENLVRLIARNDDRYGIYHYADDGIISWHEFATAIRDEALRLGLLTKSIPIEPIPTEAYPLPAPRPRNSAFDKSKVRNLLGFTVNSWRHNLERFLETEQPPS